MIRKYLDYWFSLNGIAQIIEIFQKEKQDIRFIGGCVRNALLGVKTSDIDLAISCNPNITADILIQNNIKALEYGKLYGTITAVIDKKNIEITSLREDQNQSGRYTEVVFTNDWYKDALRRDFTFNAININPEGKIEDYFNGQNDLKNQLTHFIGEIEQRIQQDYLRILRYFRFLGIFEKPILNKNYENILYSNLDNLKIHVKHDRIRIELLKMLKNKFKMNSIINLHDRRKSNTLIKTIKEWWIEDQYDLGLQKCMNTIDELIMKFK